MDPAAMEGKDEPLEFKRVLDNIRVRINDILFQVKRLLCMREGKKLCRALIQFLIQNLSHFFFLSCLLRVIGTFHIRIEQLELKCMSSGKLCSYIYRHM